MYFCHSRNYSNIRKNIFNSISIYFWKKDVLIKKYRKKMCYKENNSIFWRHEKWQKFILQKFVIFNVIPDCFLIRKWGTLEHARRDVWKNLRILDCRILLLLAFFKLLENHASIGKSFSFPFLQILLIKTSKLYLKKFLISYLALC